MSPTPSNECRTSTSTGGKKPQKAKAIAPSGALSPHQITALIQQGKWWPFDRVDGKLLVRLHRQTVNATTEDLPEALL